KLPAGWEQSGKPDLDIDGAVWFRKQIQVPAEWADRDLILQLGPIDDNDVTYFNGVEIGSTGLDVPESWQKPRSYNVPARLVKAGNAVIAVRVMDSAGGGGIYAGPMTLVPEGLSSGPINLATDWKYLVEASRPTLPPSFWNTQPQQPYGPGSAVAPTNLWNGMIHPLLPFAIKGAIWYQGESNAGRAYQYRSLFPGMIKDWRSAWGRGDFPFYYVQLANFMAKTPEPVESEWAELREAQTMTLNLRNTGMALAIDIGEAADIHPFNKSAVGERLARWALARDYGQTDIVASGPFYKSHEVASGQIVLSFEFAEMGLASLSGQALKGFAIAGEDRKFVWAQAKIVGSQVVVSSPLVRNPVAVRYAWSNNPDCNLINKAGLPASPFRTDSWPGLTIDRR
ncbi:MAG: 9-O-acetylesterase, partial [Chlorobia bacterium]|nr:9-O-acetylesterase [Fimbriimonadaceae bacterium]